MSEDECLVALRARARIPYPAYLPCFKRERGRAQQCNYQYSKGRKVCGHSLARADCTPDVKGKHQQQCNVGGGFDARPNRPRDWLQCWLEKGCTTRRPKPSSS